MISSPMVEVHVWFHAISTTTNNPNIDIFNCAPSEYVAISCLVTQEMYIFGLLTGRELPGDVVISHSHGTHLGFRQRAATIIS